MINGHFPRDSYAHDLWVGDMPMPAREDLPLTVFLLCLDVLLPSPLRVTADRFPFPFLLIHDFTPLYYPSSLRWHRACGLITEAILMEDIRCVIFRFRRNVEHM